MYVTFVSINLLFILTVICYHQALIFCRTKIDCDNLEQYLLAKGGGPKAMVNEYSCVCLHSDRSAGQRKANLQAFKVMEKHIHLAATKVAAIVLRMEKFDF